MTFSRFKGLRKEPTPHSLGPCLEEPCAAGMSKAVVALLRFPPELGAVGDARVLLCGKDWKTLWPHQFSGCERERLK